MIWTEGRIHLAARKSLRTQGWLLIAGEFPGGSDHELYPLNVTDPTVARDQSPDPRRHSHGELIPDIVALKDTRLILCEAKVKYNAGDQAKLLTLIGERKEHLLAALRKFAIDRDFQQLLPVERLSLHPVLIFSADSKAPPPITGFSYLRIADGHSGAFEGILGEP